MKKHTGTLYGKLALDLVLFALLVLMYQKRLISMEFHEIGGLALFGLFLVHKALNWKWLRAALGAVLLAAALCFGTYSLRQTAYLSWLKEPAVILTAGEETPALAPEHVPGSGAHGGKGDGKGLGNGQGKEQESPDAHTVSVSNVLRTAASYGSITLWFAILTAGAQTALRKGKAARKA